MQFDLNIEATVRAAIEEALAPATLRQKVTDLVGGCVDRALSDQFKSYGKFGEVVASAIKATIPHEVSIDGAARFDHLLKAVIEKRLEAYNNERVAQLMEPVFELLTPPPAEITLTKLVQDAVECWQDNYRRNGAQQPTVIVEKSEYGSRWIHMDPKADVERYACSVRIGVNDHDNKMFGLKLEGSEVGKTMFAGDFYGWERDIFALYTRGSKLVVDAEDFSDVYYQGED